ncbi:superoxide dismutase family protein [Pseudoroseicyclus aestuarii]|uniref:Cu-Zn family superoxide dismutase n=1 Tax=Pseudoroseicyclus aestuarii TaxID=1795041 RepID=A0A318STR6_9RHOB|nr:superoxide dismutase family protein [Pseudoroseicyclus aestuarii]PYE83769.1 Cu-Zn family superoxide dismutase [Pseudoroseicyclus aestuarii]
MTRFALAATAALLLPVAATAQDATATLMAQDGTEHGTVNFTQGPNGVLVEARATGLPEGPHGFHIHETGACEGDFTSAGDHFAPGGNGHGFLSDGGYHAGDLPILHAAADGTATADFFVPQLSLGDGGEADMMDEDGSAVMFHAEGDSYMEEAGSGDRLACGVIEAAE